MTKQLTIKLNEERFNPILNDLNQFGFGFLRSNSAMTSFSLWFMWWFTHHKTDDGRTVFEKYAQSVDKSEEECILYCVREYCEFASK